jgi:cell division protein FtsW
MRKEGDIVLFLTMITLVIIGLIMIASVSVYESYNTFGINDFYFWRRVGHMLVAFAGFLFCFLTPYRIWEKISIFLMIGSVIMLVLVLTAAGADYGTAKSWLNFAGFSIQPVEFAKFALIIYLAHWMSAHRHEIKDFKYGFIPFIGILGFIVSLVALQPDFGSIIVISLSSIAVFLAAGGSLLQVFGGAAVASIPAYYIVLTTPYIYNRFLAFFNPELDALGIGYQIQNALTAIGSGGWFGVGFGKSIQKNGYLPEVQGDAIIAAIAEELGFIRTTMILILFGILIWRSFEIAKKTKDPFAKLVVVGVAASIGIQAFINIAVNTGIFPNTGITLPFISYGGSSLLISMIGVGLILNISKGTTAPEPSGGRRSYHSKGSLFGRRRRRSNQ